MREITDQKQLFIDFFGKYVTEPRYPKGIQAVAVPITPEEMRKHARNAPYLTVFHKNPNSRFTYFSAQDQLTLFVDGEPFHCRHNQLTLVQNLCSTLWSESLELKEIMQNDDDLDLIAKLITQGSLLNKSAADE